MQKDCIVQTVGQMPVEDACGTRPSISASRRARYPPLCIPIRLQKVDVAVEVLRLLATIESAEYIRIGILRVCIRNDGAGLLWRNRRM